MREYDEIFDWYVADRNPEVGIADVAAFCRTLAPGARVLDLGCGNGVPITRLLVAEGLEVYGVDSSAKMIAGFRANFPQVPVQCVTIQDSDFFGMSFAAVISWGVFFHLSAADQEAAIAKVSRGLEPYGKLLFTSGDSEGTRTGKMNEVDFTYVSPGPQNYERILTENGMKLLDQHLDKWDNCYYIAEKVRS